MDIVSLFLLAIGLSMDAFALSVSNGMRVRAIRLQQVFLISFSFGMAQGIMPLIGYFGGQLFSVFLDSIDHWVALILLGFIGSKMIFEAVKAAKDSVDNKKEKGLSVNSILLQAVATSIDAMAAGVSLAAMKVDIWGAAVIISITTFLFCTVGVFIGKKCGDILAQKAEIFGGFILIALGFKIFIEDLFFI